MQQQQRNAAADSNAIFTHCERLREIGLEHAVFAPISGALTDYFIADGDTMSAGQFGDVMLVRGKDTGEPFAIKTFRKTLKLEEMQRQLQRFSLILAFSRSFSETKWPSTLVRYIEAFEFQQPAPEKALLMQRIDGVSLQKLIDERREVVPAAQWKCWMKDILDALVFLHSHGITHRDVHPGNIMIKTDGKSAVLIDLDLMCTPAHGQYCYLLCRGPALALSTAPDLWCNEDVVNAKNNPQVWYKSDVWATANAFLSYLTMQNGYLNSRVAYSDRRNENCAKVKDENVVRIVDIALRLVQDEKLRNLLNKMLSPHEGERPTAAQASAQIENCTNRSSFKMPPTRTQTYTATQPVVYVE